MAAKNFSWRKLRIWIQAISLVGWITGFILIVQPLTSHAVARALVLIDPLLSWNQAIASRNLAKWVIPGSIFLLLALIVGRAWCGWVCPIGTTLDLFSFLTKFKGVRKVPEKYRKIKYLLVFAIIIAAVGGSLTLLIFDPVSIWLRIMVSGIWPVFNSAFSAGEELLARVSWLTPAIVWLDQLARPVILPVLRPGTASVTLHIVLFLILFGLSLIALRFWCRYLCPLGAIYGWLARFSLVQRKVLADCKGCGLCAKNCPTETINPLRQYQSDPAECTLCMNCVESCPTSQIKFSVKHPKPIRQIYDPTRRDFMAASLITITGLAVASAESLHHDRVKPSLRPPGVDPDSFTSQCLRCGICVRVCPTGAIQPGIAKVNWSDLFTPTLSLRDGYCLYSCNACGQFCPVEAIPPLALAQKQTAILGRAYIDHNRCIPWAEGGSCIVCEEMCPLPEKAITLDIREETLPDGSRKTLRLPVVNQELCIGCGTCENKCPRAGEAAIRVFPLDFV